MASPGHETRILGLDFAGASGPLVRSWRRSRKFVMAEHREVGDVTTLADATVMHLIKQRESDSASEG